MSGIEVVLNPLDWNGISAISSALMLLINIFLLATVMVGFRALREEVKNRDTHVLLWAIGEIEKIKPHIHTVRNAGRYATGAIGSDAYSVKWPSDTQEAANAMSITLQRLSYMAENELISKRHLADMWGPTFTECWELLEDFVQHKRFDHGEPLRLVDGAFSRKDFESYSAYCTARRKS